MREDEEKPEYEEVIADNFISAFGLNINFLDDKGVLEEKVNYFLKFADGKEGLAGIYNDCLKAKNHEYPITDWFRFAIKGFHEVYPSTPHDLDTAKGCYDWFCDMVKLFADILFEHGIITEEEKQLAYVETKLEQKDAEVKRR